MRPLLPSLSHRSLTIKKVGEAPGIRKAELGRYTRLIKGTDSPEEAEKISTDLEPLEQLTGSRRIMTVSFRLSLRRCSSRRTGTQLQ